MIAEGIELAEELTVLGEMGVDLVQGYLLGRPQEYPLREDFQPLLQKDSEAPAARARPDDLRALLIEQRAVRVDSEIEEVLDAFKACAGVNSWLCWMIMADPAALSIAGLVDHSGQGGYATDERRVSGHGASALTTPGQPPDHQPGSPTPR